jgi:fructosamine-3-kinase
MDSHRTAISLAQQAARLLGAEPAREATIAGGNLSEVVEIELRDGRTVVAKGGPSPAIEAEMLAAIRATGAAAPAVVAYDDSVLVLERLPAGGAPGDAWSDLGVELSKLHSVFVDESSGSQLQPYGWHCDYAFGLVRIENAHVANWPSFWSERRLANQAPHVASDLAARIERLAADLAGRLPARPPPSLLHGDLWTGNILAAEGRVTGLIDPACYFGDREVDLAMLRLFGAPDAKLFESYGPLASGHEERLPIYQLWPALVHIRLFGQGYRPMVERLLAASGV